MQGVHMYQTHAKYRPAVSIANLFVSSLPVWLCVYIRCLREGVCYLFVIFKPSTHPQLYLTRPSWAPWYSHRLRFDCAGTRSFHLNSVLT